MSNAKQERGKALKAQQEAHEASKRLAELIAQLNGKDEAAKVASDQIEHALSDLADLGQKVSNLQVHLPILGDVVRNLRTKFDLTPVEATTSEEDLMERIKELEGFNTDLRADNKRLRRELRSERDRKAAPRKSVIRMVREKELSRLALNDRTRTARHTSKLVEIGLRELRRALDFAASPAGRKETADQPLRPVGTTKTLDTGVG